MVTSPQVDVDSIEDTEEREAPGDTVNDGTLATGEELVNDGAEKENVDQRPNEERPWCGGNVGLFTAEVWARLWSSDGIDIRT
jgi:hypothetical protein